MRKQNIFKVMRRLNITGTKRRDPSRGNQVAHYVTRSEVDQIRGEFRSRYRGGRAVDDEVEDNAFYSAEEGVFYLIQLEPGHDPQRFKVGFAASIGERLRALRCSAPFADVRKTWPCLCLWGKTAIDCVCAGCEQVHTEVFRAGSIDEVMVRCDNFFRMMPSLSGPEKEQQKPLADTGGEDETPHC